MSLFPYGRPRLRRSDGLASRPGEMSMRKAVGRGKYVARVIKR